MIQGVPYQSFPSSFQRDLLAVKKRFGKGSSLANEISTKVLGVAGLDRVVLDGEHSPNNGRTLLPQMMALKDSPTAPVVRPAYNTAVKIKQLLDAGFYKFLIPFVISAEEGRSAVSATCYPPRGIRGVSVSPRGSSNCTVTNFFNSVHDHICAYAGQVYKCIFPLAAMRMAA
jgi:2-dehydro-3-deoxyglucarate aldolase